MLFFLPDLSRKVVNGRERVNSELAASYSPLFAALTTQMFVDKVCKACAPLS
jgi:hypothetical protein